MKKMLQVLGVLPDAEAGDTFTVRPAAVGNLFGKTHRIPNGDFYHVRFSVVAWVAGRYPWFAGMGSSAADARRRANGRPCVEPEPPVRPNTAEFCRGSDGVYPSVARGIANGHGQRFDNLCAVTPACDKSRHIT